MQTSRDTRTALRPSSSTSTQRRPPARRYTMASSSSEQASTSRPSTTDNIQLGPISQFEHHLKYLSDSYLAFFQERAKAEEAYVESLSRLHKKAKAFDIYLDDRRDSTTLRHVWSEVRDGVEREAQSRQAFLSALTVDVINPILALKETQDRTRKRIREDIKDSTLAHQDYLENVLPRLKRTYIKKCQEVEDNKSAAATSSSPPGSDAPSLAPSRSQPSTAPVVTSPQPLRPLARRASGHAPQARNRSPSGSNPLQDLAHTGKRQLNQLMTFLDKQGGTIKDGGNKSDMAVRTVRAKREAEEADKEYRKGVHWLETLRIRRIKILEGAFTSFESFVEESAQKMKNVLESYTENSIATTTTLTHLGKHARSLVDHISPSKDTQTLVSYVPRYIQQYCPRRTLYTNYYVGDCNDLIFGVSLVDYATSRGLQDGQIPKIVRICIHEIESRGMSTEGIYRISGRHAVVQDVIHRTEKDERNFMFAPSDDVFVVSSLLKQYLRTLPEPLFKFPLEERVKHTEDLGDHVQNNFLFLRGKMRRLPPVHLATLRAIVEHLARIAANCEKNKMDSKNLAIIFGGFIFGEDEVPKTADLLSFQSWKDSLMEDLISNSAVLFDDRNAAASSHPLPPEPTGEEPLPYGYGSSYTQVANVPPALRHQKTDSQASQQDFTPQLPLRPGNSIHPSRRANQSNRTNDSETDDEPIQNILPSRPPGAAPPNPMVASSSEASETTTVGELVYRPQRRHVSASESESSPTSAAFASARSSPGSQMSPLSSNLALPQVSQGAASLQPDRLTEDLPPTPTTE